MKKFIALLLLALSCLFSSGQKNLIPGYIIKHDGDTVPGLIDYQNWRVNPSEITFMESENSAPVVYRSTQIKGFFVNDKIYESAVVQVETSPVDDRWVNNDANLIYRTDSVFLKVRMRGPKTLYYYFTRDLKDQFYIPTDTSVDLLIYKKYKVEETHPPRTYKAENKMYIFQLAGYLGDCRTLDYRIKNSIYSKRSIDNIFLEYAKCTGKDFDYIRQKDERRTEVGFMAGASMTKVNFSGEDYPYLLNTDYSISTNFTAGVFFDYVQVKNDRRLSLSNELLITGFKLEEQYYVYEDEKNYSTTDVDISMVYLKWHGLGRYKFPVGKKMFIYVNAGPSFGLGSVSENQMVQHIKIVGFDRTITDNAVDYINSFEVGAVGGVGFRMKDFSLECRYEWGDGFSGDDELTARTNRMYFMLGYRL